MKIFLYIMAALAIFYIIGSISSEDKLDEVQISPQDSIRQQFISDSIKALPIYTAAEADSIALQKKKEKSSIAKKQLSTLIKNCDEFKNVCFYRHKNNAKYRNANDFGLYIGEDEGSYYLRLKVQYYADEWLFANSVQVKTDSGVIDLSLEDFERDHDGGKIWEWSDTQVDNFLLSALETISESKSVKLRFNGTQYHDDRTVSSSKIQALRDVLKIYKAIK